MYYSKELLPILVTLVGKVIFVAIGLFLKASTPMVVKFVEESVNPVILFNSLLLSAKKAFSPILVTLAGITNVPTSRFLLKALEDIVCKVFGKEIVGNLLSLKAKAPIVIKFEFKIKLVIASPSKPLAAILVAVLGTVTVLANNAIPALTTTSSTIPVFPVAAPISVLTSAPVIFVFNEGTEPLLNIAGTPVSPTLAVFAMLSLACAVVIPTVTPVLAPSVTTAGKVESVTFAVLAVIAVA